MQRQIASLLFITLWVGTLRSGDPSSTVEEFIAYYHEHPNPDDTPQMLRLVLNDKGRDVKQLHVAHSFGHIARTNPKLVRAYEAQFEKADSKGRLFLLNALRLCGDDLTLKCLDRWVTDRALANEKDEVEAARSFLRAPKRKLPRDCPARGSNDLDLLWADFLVTGEYAPVSRILDTLDKPGNLRDTIDRVLKTNLDERKELLNALHILKLIEPDTEEMLISGNLEMLLLHDERGRLKEANLRLAAIVAKKWLKLSDEELGRGLVLKGAASWSLQSNLQLHPRLREVLKEHHRERPVTSQTLVKKWLRLDRPKRVLGAEAQRLQGTWQATSWEEDGSEPNLLADMLKFTRWSFEEDELSITRALTFTADGKEEVRGDGGTLILTYKVDASREPKVITGTLSADDGEGAFQWIYKVEGDILKVCRNKDGAIPREFSAKQGSKGSLITFKRMPLKKK